MIERILAPLHALLAPPIPTCLACGKRMTKAAQGYPEICRACVAQIPWIIRPRCAVCGRSIGCPDCTRPGVAASRHFACNRSAVAYDPLMREWLAQYKYRGREAFTPIFQRMMGQAYKRMASELSGPPHAVSPWHIDAVTYVPLSPSRLRERGFNQAELLAIGAAAAAKAPLIDILERTRDTQKQSSKTRRERLSDMKSAFQLQPHAADVFQQILSRRRTLSKKNEIKILLIDDVYTTGSTLNYCSLALLQACTDLGISAQMYSLTWARS